MKSISIRDRLLASTIIGGAALLAVPASAQTAPPPAAEKVAAAAEDNDAIVVTGSIIRRANIDTASPVTVVTADDIEKRGIQTVQGVIQLLAASNGPQLTNNFTANGAFAGGASGASLRGLTTSSTLTLIDGLRATYYPLADDGTRNFVDLNTIPDEIVDRVEVLKDGASSTYGADAVAGVINIITKKEVTGLHVTGEAGISQRGDAANHRVSATYGYGKLNDQGFNAYISAHYVDSAQLNARQRGYPYNTDNLTGICYQGVCGPNNIANGVTNGVFNGLSTAPDVFFVRPANATNSAALGRYQILNPAAGCGSLPSYTLSNAEFTAPTNTTAPRTVCQQDITQDYGVIEPKLQRYGVSGRFTARVFDNSEFYIEGNYERSKSFYTGLASIIRGNAPAGIDFPAYSTSAAGVYGNTVLALPVYICPRGTVTCTAANGTLNPNNPFAALGQTARIIGRLPTSEESNATDNQVYRLAASLHGSFGDSWDYSVDGTANISRLTTTANGYVYIQHLLDEIADGSYNFVNPQQTSQAALDYLTPTQTNKSSSHLYQVQANISKGLFDLPGGTVHVGVGGQVRYESLEDPSGNPDYLGPTERYFRLNAFGATGHRYVESGYFEIVAPVLKSVEITGSGRYDHYSTGQSNFSPKIGATFKPFEQLTFRGTFSRGFRIPSFAESGALPTTGYVTVAPASLPASFRNQHLNSVGGPNTYLTAYSIGETTVGNPDLKAEKSRNYNLGATFKPVRNVIFTADYYNIRKTAAITSVNFQSAIDNYYATGGTSFNGVTIIQDEPDIDHPGSQNRVAFAQGSFINANSIVTSGIDIALQASFQVTDNIKFTTSGEATYIIKLNTSFPDGHTEHYAGTLGNFNLTAGSGTQRYKANWQNTIDFGKVASLTATAYYTSGYNYSAEDQGSISGDCSLVPTNNAGDAYQPCNVKSFVQVDLHGAINVNEHFTLYADVQNVADRKPPIDGTTYGANLYNPVVGDAGIIGRSFRVGAKVNF